MAKQYHADGVQWIELADERPPIALRAVKQFNVSHLAGWGDNAEQYRAFALAVVKDCYIQDADGNWRDGVLSVDVLESLDYRQLDWLHSEIVGAIFTLPLVSAPPLPSIDIQAAA